MRTWEKILAVVTLVSVVAAWGVGMIPREIDIVHEVYYALPGVQKSTETSPGIYEGRAYDDTILGYRTSTEANGYGGPMHGFVGVDPEGNIVRMTIYRQVESPAFLLRVENADFFEKLQGKKSTDSFIVGEDIDGVTGATRTVEGLALAAKRGAQRIAREQLKLPVPPEEPPPIRFGLPEVTLIALLGVGLALYTKRLSRRPKWKTPIRWTALIAGLIMIGFVYNSQLSLSNVNALLLGYWPVWQTHIYWYLLILGVLAIPLVTDKDPYCHAACPFGAAQECLGAMGGAQRRVKPRIRNRLRWIPRIIAWVAILLALIYRNPAHVNYEVYGALFAFVGTYFIFGLLAIVLIASLLIKRPWCNYLCPIRPVRDYLHFMKKWTRETFQRQK